MHNSVSDEALHKHFLKNVNSRHHSTSWGVEIISFTVPNWDHTVPASSDGRPRVAWRALEMLVVFTTASKREGTWYV